MFERLERISGQQQPKSHGGRMALSKGSECFSVLRLRTLSLITRGACGHSMDGGYPVYLPAFRSLRSTSWTGVWSAEDFDALHDVLQGNSAHLTRLQLDFFSCTEADNSWYVDRGRRDKERSENLFAKDVLGLSTA
jgi:hypothetical protein